MAFGAPAFPVDTALRYRSLSMFGRRWARGAGILLAAVLGSPGAAGAGQRPSLVLVTLDTARADVVGGREGDAAVTPNLDALARSGTRFTRALTASPLTLPAHCTLMTGVDPPVHGVRDNGVSALPTDLPTLASVLASRGYGTAAFVASHVLDRRFGLARGFGVYDDAMVAEQIGEQGYPERNATAVTDAALAWLARRPPTEPFFLWVHYYDAHAPYAPPGERTGATAARRYAGELSYVDRELARLLAALPKSPAGERPVVAAVGDHGEMLGEHGEKEHGIFLYRAALEVPLILSGPGVPAGLTVAAAVGTRALPSTLLRLVGLEKDMRPFGPGLPGLEANATAGPWIYSETWMPASAYGWSPLRAVSEGRWRLVMAPRPELYDLAADPRETENLFSRKPDEARRLARLVGEVEGRARPAPAPVASPADAAELREALRNLGYLSGASPRAGTIDPKDGIALLPEFERAREWIRQGRSREAVGKLRDLVRRSPGNVPFLVRLGEAEVAAGDTDAGLATVREAIALNPHLDLLHTSAGRLYAQAGRIQEAKGAYEAAVALNPRSAPAWMGLSEIAARTGTPKEERAVLSRAEAAGTRSAAILTRLAQLELAAGALADARRHAEESTRLLPALSEAWWVAGEVAEKQGRMPAALESYERAVGLGLADPRAFLRLGKLQREAGREAAARRSLERAVALGGRSVAAEDARRLLAAEP